MLHGILDDEVASSLSDGFGELRGDGEFLVVADRLDATIGRIAVPLTSAPTPLTLRRTRARERAPATVERERDTPPRPLEENTEARSSVSPSSHHQRFRASRLRL